ncbi:MAG: DNA polymerase III subunit gamma/tau [Vulcanimicrobiaceae bacterium]
MSLYRTWRPKTFADLVGQDAVVRTLSSAIESGKLAHAYLFSGPRGSGKTSAAKILARCIDCVNGPTATPDNTCEFCQAMLAGTALDVLEIDAASNRGIDEIRALRDAVKFAPSVMRMKVYIIDEAHMLTKEGANAFLKTLEEPPPHAVFILATTEPEKLPVTILSRCQRYAFRRISIPVMIERMREIAAAEGIAIDDQALSAIAYRADGGLRDALTMLEQAAAFSDGKVDTQTIDLAFGATGRNYARTLLDRALSRDAAGVLETINEASDAGTDMQVLIRSLIGEFRNLLVGRIDPALLSRDLAPEDAARAAERAQDVAQAHIIRALRLLTEALATARSSGHPRLELESALLRFVLAGEDPTLDALSARIAVLEAGGAPQIVPARAPQSAPEPHPAAESKPPKAKQPAKHESAVTTQVEPPPEPAPEPTPQPVTPAAPGEVTIQKVRAAWQSIRTKVESEKQSLRTQLSRAVPEEVDGNALVIKLPNSLMADILKDNAKLIEGAIADVLGAPLRTTYRVDGSAAAVSRGKSGAAVTNPTITAEPDEDPDHLFSYLNERFKE